MGLSSNQAHRVFLLLRQYTLGHINRYYTNRAHENSQLSTPLADKGHRQSASVAPTIDRKRGKLEIQIGNRIASHGWVDPFAFGVVRMLIGFARISSFCESVRIANQFAGRQKQAEALQAESFAGRSIANPGRIRANPFRLRIVANCEWSTQHSSAKG